MQGSARASKTRRLVLLALGPLILGQAPAGLPPQVSADVQQALAADAPGAPSGTPIAFHGGLQGVVVFAQAIPTPDGPCRTFTLSTSNAHYAGRACLSTATHQWRVAWLPAKLPAPALAPIAKPPPPTAAYAPPAAVYAAPLDHSFQHATPHAGAPPPQPAIVPPPPPAAAPVPGGGAIAPGPKPAPAKVGVLEQASAEIIKQIQAIQIEYNKPDAISFDTDTTIVLVAESHDTASGHALVAGAGGEVMPVTAALSAIVTAQLLGDSDQVQITPLTTDTQAVSSLTNTQWSWNVRAKQPGTASLTLNVFDNVTVNGQSTYYRIKTYTNQFRVVISPLSSLRWQFEQIDPIWQALGLGTPVALIGGLIAWLRRPRKAAASPASS
jgi:hypothetical protein